MPATPRRRLLAALLSCSTSMAVVPFMLSSRPAAALPAAADVARRYADAIVTVERPCPADAPACSATRSQGFFVSSTGLVATLLPGSRVEDVVTLEGEAPAERAVVVVVDPDGLALLRLVAPPTAPLTALAVSATGKRSRWLIGLSREARGVQAVVGGEEPGGLLVPVPRGAPILNEDHEVIAVCSRSRGGGLIDVLPVARLQALARRATSATAPKAATPTPMATTTTPGEHG